MWVKYGYIIGSQVQSKFIFNIVNVKFDTFVIPVGEFPNTLFIERCRQRFQIRLVGVLKTFLDAEWLSSHTCLHLLKKRKVTWWEDWPICRVIEYFLSKLWKKLLDYRSSALSWIKNNSRMQHASSFVLNSILQATQYLTIQTTLETESITHDMLRGLHNVESMEIR